MKNPEQVAEAMKKQGEVVHGRIHKIARDNNLRIKDLTAMILRRTGLSQDTLLRITKRESKKLPRTIDTLAKIADAMDCDVSIVFQSDKHLDCNHSRKVTITHPDETIGTLADTLQVLRLCDQSKPLVSRPYRAEDGLHCPTFESYFDALIDLGFTPWVFLDQRTQP